MHRQCSRGDASVADAACILGLIMLALGIVVYAHIAAARSARDLEKYAPSDRRAARNSMLNPSLPAERTITIRADLDPAVAGGYTHPYVE